MCRSAGWARSLPPISWQIPAPPRCKVIQDLKARLRAARKCNSFKSCSNPAVTQLTVDEEFLSLRSQQQRKTRRKRHQKGQKQKKDSSVFFQAANFLLLFPPLEFNHKTAEQHWRRGCQDSRGRVAVEVGKKGESKQRAGTGETFTAERLAHTPTTRLMQEAEGRGSYYVVDYNGQKKVLSLNWKNSDFCCFARWNVITGPSPISHIREKKKPLF